MSRHALDYGATHVVIDDIGVGGGVTDKLTRMRREGNLADMVVIGLNIQRVSKKKDRRGQPKYADIKAELSMIVREKRFIAGRIGLDEEVRNTTLQAEGCDTRYGFRKRGAAVFEIEPKDEYRRRHSGESPNFWDAFILSMYVKTPSILNVGWAP